MAREARLGSVLTTGGNNELYIEGAVWTEEVEALVHLAQQFTLDQLRAQGANLGFGCIARIPETLE